jgi:hypothetical protein
MGLSGSEPSRRVLMVEGQSDCRESLKRASEFWGTESTRSATACSAVAGANFFTSPCFSQQEPRTRKGEHGLYVGCDFEGRRAHL